MCEQSRIHGAFMVGNVKWRWAVLDSDRHMQVPLPSKPVSIVGTKAVSYAACDQSGQSNKNKLDFHLCFCWQFEGIFVKSFLAMLTSPVSKDFGGDIFPSSNFLAVWRRHMPCSTFPANPSSLKGGCLRCWWANFHPWTSWRGQTAHTERGVKQPVTSSLTCLQD